MTVGKKPRKPLPRYTRLAPGGRPRAKKRSAEEYARIHDSTAHTEWMKGLPCFCCGRTPCDSAHVRNEGMSRKASWRKTVPLCSDRPGFVGCHTLFDGAKATWRANYDMDAAAEHYVAAWRAFQERTGAA